jgi:hypothetical protein
VIRCLVRLLRVVLEECLRRTATDGDDIGAEAPYGSTPSGGLTRLQSHSTTLDIMPVRAYQPLAVHPLAIDA